MRLRMDVRVLALPVLAVGVGWLSTACAGPPRLLAARDPGSVSERPSRRAGAPAAPAQRDDDLAFCVAETNRYRTRHGMPPLRRSAELEAYAAAGARYDTAVRIPHKHFDDTPGGHLAYAENECLSFQGWSLRRAVRSHSPDSGPPGDGADRRRPSKASRRPPPARGEPRL